MLTTLSIVAASLYLATLPPRWNAGTRLSLGAAAVLLHGYLAYTQIFPGDALQIGVAEAMTLVAWQAAALLWALCLREPLQVLQTWIFPMAAGVAVVSTLLPPGTSENAITDWRIQLHVVLSVLSIGVLTLAVAQSGALAVQDRLLHHHHAGSWMQRNLPPLQTMERLLFTLIATGFFLLSLTLVTGLLFIQDMFAQHLAHKTVLSICAWAILGWLLWGRWRFGWRGRRAIRWTTVGYTLLLLAYFGSKIILELVLGRHWT